jgi:predicted secreted hydrolase
MKRARQASVGGLLLLGTACLALFSVGPEEWARADRPRIWTFPADHGAHPAFRTEWWYFTGVLAGPDEKAFGYQLTFFRQGLRPAADDPANAWSLRDAAMAHFTITDEAAGTFRSEDRLVRTGPGLAGWSAATLDVHVLGWSARLENGAVALRASKGGIALDLVLVPRKPPVLHGQGGLSRKGPAEGESSYYSSWTDLETKGTMTPGPGRAPLAVRGRSWFDHEFGSGMLSPEQAGWDWFSLHLSDGRDLMIYLLRRRDGSIEKTSSGTLIDAEGRARPLGREEILIDVLDHWSSARSGGRYPSRWRVRLPGERIDLEILPIVPDQEVRAASIPALVYWEGAVRGQGRARGRALAAEGYVELTGYAGDLRRVF